MIVVDANILVYLIIHGDMTEAALRARAKDPDWKSSPLCEYEFGNALTLMTLQKHITITKAVEYLQLAKTHFAPYETQGDPELALQIAAGKKISFYDAQYLTLARMLGVPLVTEDKALRKAAGDWAISLKEFIN